MHRVLTTLGCALTAVLAAAWPAAPPTQSARPAAATTVRTHDGLVRGAAHDRWAVGAGYRTFEGIPYAAPPVDRLRWAPPRRAAPWTGVRDATRPANACPQLAGEVPGGSTDEDCLHLNITTPDGAGPTRPRPVIVWLHGGGFTTGAGSSYDAHRLATRGDVVVVTVNYRLGALGFLAHSGLPGSGTFGLADQQAALRWVRTTATTHPATVTEEYRQRLSHAYDSPAAVQHALGQVLTAPPCPRRCAPLRCATVSRPGPRPGRSGPCTASHRTPAAPSATSRSR